jgi:hypothetical protein
MRLSDIAKGINIKLAGEQHPIRELVPFLDDAVDRINQDLNTVFPSFSSLPTSAIEYTAIPDKYIRTVLFFGAAYYYYQADEEGQDSARAYQEQFERNLFFMLRDYLQEVPEEFQASTEQGSLVHDMHGVDGQGIESINWGAYRI